MATEFNDAQHYALFKGPGAIRTGNSFEVRWSEITLAALRSAGFLDNMVDGTVPPSIDKFWLDKNTDPAILKEWDPVGAAWVQVTAQTLFGRVPFKGDWETSPIYRPGDLVFYGTNIWIARLPSQNHPPAEDAYWDVFIDGSSYATAEQGALAETALQPTTGLYRLATFANAGTDYIPASVSTVYVEDRGARFSVVGSEPSHALKFENGGRWWEISEPVVTARMAGAKGDGVADDTAALNAFAAYSTGGSLSAGKGRRVELVSGRYRITGPIEFKFASDVRAAEGTARYGALIVVDAAFVGDAAVIVSADTEAFTGAYLAGISIDCNGVSGVEGLRFEGAYWNSTLRNLFIFDVAADTIGLHVRPLYREGINVCESVLLENIYVIPATTEGTITMPAILLDRCQETTLTNVKGFGRNPQGTGTPGAAGIKLLDCRGVVLSDCSAAFSKYGIEIEASTRQCTGVTVVGPVYEGVSDTSLYVHGTSSHKVTNVTQIGTRLEAPMPTTGLSADHVDYLIVDLAFQNAVLGANTSSITIDGFGTVTAATGAKFVQLSSPNAVLDKYRINGIVASYKTNSPSFDLMVEGRSGQYRWQWSATQSVDNWARFQNPAGNTLISMGETSGTGVARLGFFGTAAIEKRAVTGSRDGNAALTSLLTQLAAYGLIANETTA